MILDNLTKEQLKQIIFELRKSNDYFKNLAEFYKEEIKTQKANNGQ